MFSEEMLKEVPQELEKIFRDLEDDVLTDIVRRLKAMQEFTGDYQMTRSADYQLWIANQLKTYDSDLKKKIQKALKLSDEQVKHLYSDVIEQGYAQDESLYIAADETFIPLEDNKGLKQLIDACQKQTTDDINNLTRTMGFITGNNTETVTSYFKDELNKATLEIATGSFDYDSTLKRVVNEMANSGIRYVDYESGHRDRIDVASRRAVMTGLRQVTEKISEDNAKQLNTEYFEVSAHTTARPSHALWQGKVYTKQQLIDICGLGTGEGLCGWNCYHTYEPFIYGVSKRRYSDEELSKIFQQTQQSKEYKGKTYTPYEATQRQRALERRMRVQDEKIKLLKEGGADKNDISQVKTRRSATYQEYKAFSKEMGLPEQMNRVFNSERKK